MRISDWSSDVCSSDLTTINANDQLRSIQDYEQLIVAYENGAPLRLRDVADARQDAENIRQAAWIGTTPAILLNIQRQPGANVIDVVDRVKALLPSLKQALPVGVEISVEIGRGSCRERVCQYV